MGFPSSKFGEKTQNVVLFVEKHHIFIFSSLVFGCYFFQVKWEFSKMGSQTRISCYPGAKWDPILSGMYCIPPCYRENFNRESRKNRFFFTRKTHFHAIFEQCFLRIWQNLKNTFAATRRKP